MGVVASACPAEPVLWGWFPVGPRALTPGALVQQACSMFPACQAPTQALATFPLASPSLVPMGQARASLPLQMGTSAQRSVAG